MDVKVENILVIPMLSAEIQLIITLVCAKKVSPEMDLIAQVVYIE